MVKRCRFAGYLLVCAAAALAGGWARAEEDWKVLAAKAKGNIAETRQEVSGLNAELRAWDSRLTAEIASAKADEAKWAEAAASNPDGDKKKEASQYRTAYSSHASTLATIERSAAPLVKMGEALDSDQALLEASQDRLEKAAGAWFGGDTMAARQGLDSTFSKLQEQDLRTELTLQLLDKLHAYLEDTDKQMRQLLVGLGTPDPAARWRWEVRENDLRLGAGELAHVETGSRLAGQVRTLLRKTAITLKYQVDLAKAIGH